MSLKVMLKQFEKVIADNSPAILTGVGVAGTVATAVLASRATLKASAILAEDANLRITPRTKTDVLKLTWVLYIPPVASGCLTIGAIIFANRISTRRAAALAAAYSLSEKAYSEYKEKVIEKIGEQKNQKVRDEIAENRVQENPPGATVFVGGGKVLCYETYTGRYFESTMEDIKKAQNDLNYEIMNNGYASIGDFWDKIGLSRTEISDEVGWNSDQQLEIQFSTVLTEESRPCLCVSFDVNPIRNYWSFGR